MSNCLDPIYDILNMNGAPGCSKIFASVLYARGPFAMDKHIFETGSDSGPLYRLGLASHDPDTDIVDFTDDVKQGIEARRRAD